MEQLGKNSLGHSNFLKINDDDFLTYRMRPPYHAYILAAMDSLSFQVIGNNRFVFKIAPPNFVATLLAVTGTANFT